MWKDHKDMIKYKFIKKWERVDLRLYWSQLLCVINDIFEKDISITWYILKSEWIEVDIWKLSKKDYDEFIEQVFVWFWTPFCKGEEQ